MPPLLIVLTGLPYSGKTTLAQPPTNPATE